MVLLSLVSHVAEAPSCWLLASSRLETHCVEAQNASRGERCLPLKPSFLERGLEGRVMPSVAVSQICATLAYREAQLASQ